MREARHDWWFTGGMGVQVFGLVADPATASTWDFDAGVAYRLTVERQLSRQTAVGFAYSTSRTPLTYASTTIASCAQCNAKAAVSSYGGFVRFAQGNTRGLHQVFELLVGAVRFENFVRDDPKTDLQPGVANMDLAFGASYGLAYTAASDWQFFLMQDALNALHERPLESQGGGRLIRGYTTRIGARVGW